VPARSEEPTPSGRAWTVATRPRLGDQRDAWDSIGAQQPLPTPFQRSWWLENVAPHGTTYALVLDGERLVGGLAVRTRRIAGVRRLLAPGPAVLCPDHLDLLAAPGAEQGVAEVVGEWLARPGQRVLDLRGAADGALLARAVGVDVAPLDVAPYQPLSAEAGYLTGRSANFRRSVRRARRRLEGTGIEHRRVAPADLGAAFGAFRSLHAGREGRGPLLAQLPALERAVTAGVAVGEARVDVLAAGAEVVAVSLAFVVAGRLSLYQVARSLDPAHDGAGNVLLVAVIEDALAAGCHEVDLLRGGEGYKASFADRTRPVGRLRSAHGRVAAATLAAEDAARRVSATLRSRVP
jgi:CelD/BcsL family acetyltransferase involved in cellulose biosynthesis